MLVMGLRSLDSCAIGGVAVGSAAVAAGALDQPGESYRVLWDPIRSLTVDEGRI